MLHALSTQENSNTLAWKGWVWEVQYLSKRIHETSTEGSWSRPRMNHLHFTLRHLSLTHWVHHAKLWFSLISRIWNRLGLPLFKVRIPIKQNIKRRVKISKQEPTNPEESQKIKQVFFFFKSYERQQKVRNMVSQ